jgi:hypothetical protein
MEKEGFNSRLFYGCVLLSDLFHEPFVFLVAHALAGRRAPFDAGHHHVPRYGLPATLTVHVRLIRPDLVLMVAKDTDQIVRRRTRYLFASWTALFHNFILPPSGLADYEIDHIGVSLLRLRLSGYPGFQRKRLVGIIGRRLVSDNDILSF